MAEDWEEETSTGFSFSGQGGFGSSNKGFGGSFNSTKTQSFGSSTVNRVENDDWDETPSDSFSERFKNGDRGSRSARGGRGGS
jgi:hypothetical protein